DTESVTEDTETEPSETPAATEPVETAPPETQPADTAASPPVSTAPTGDVSGYAADPYLKRITFLGDSTTYGLVAYSILPDAQVWTPANGTLALFRAATDYILDRTTGAEHTIAEMCSLYQPDILVVTLGVNGISFLDEETFKSYYVGLIDIIKNASPSTHIAIQTMYPLSASYDTSNGINNTKIAAGNVWIADVAASCGVALINSAPVLTGADGFRPEEWSNDGLHLSAAGFSVVLDYIRNNPSY
ncbi:MAG: SGNH/GDSL hydrolase family protein, partial [Clostridia bacterium]|nr:SGNH/GDSL hydrolase family protein [Clostridia bacterium]